MRSTEGAIAVQETAKHARQRCNNLVHDLMEMDLAVTEMMELLETCPGRNGDDLAWTVWEGHKNRAIRRLKGDPKWREGT